ncbi:unnamed protein product [Sphagnum balticum]
MVIAYSCVTGFLLNCWIYSGYLPLSNLYESSMFLSWSFSLIHIILEVQSQIFENKCLFYCLLRHLVQANAKWRLGLQKGGFIPAASDTATTSASKEFSCCSTSGMCLRYNLTLPLFPSSLGFFLLSCSPHYSDSGGGTHMVVAIVCLLAMDIANDFQEWMLSCAFEQPITSQFLKCYQCLPKSRVLIQANELNNHFH